MEKLNYLLEGINGYISTTLDNVSFHVINKIERKNKKIFFLNKLLMRQQIIIFKGKKRQYFLCKKIIYTSHQQNYLREHNIDLKLEDLESIKLLLSQVETKEKTILLLKNDLANHTTNYNNLKITLKERDNELSSLKIDNTNLNEKVKAITSLNKNQEVALFQEKEQKEKFAQNVFELESIKKMQYETIDKLREEKRQMSKNIDKLKENFQYLLSDLKLIINKLD